VCLDCHFGLIDWLYLHLDLRCIFSILLNFDKLRDMEALNLVGLDPTTLPRVKCYYVHVFVVQLEPFIRSG